MDLEHMGGKTEPCGYCSDEELADFLQEAGQKLIWSILGRNKYGLEYEDAYQEALIATAYALKRYDSRRNVKRTTYVYNAVVTRLMTEGRKLGAAKRRPTGNTISLEDVPFDLADPADVEAELIQDEGRALLLKVCETKLSDVEKNALLESARQSGTQAELAKRLGKTQGCISLAKKRAQEKLREEKTLIEYWQLSLEEGGRTRRRSKGKRCKAEGKGVE